MSEPKNILVATDFTPPSEAAVRVAFALANKTEGTVHLLHVFTLQGKSESEVESEHEARVALEIMRQTYGPRHQEFAFALHNVALARSRRGHANEAEPLLRRSIYRFRRHFRSQRQPKELSVQESPG